ncbi:MAG: transporter permease [Bacteroidetes bacterium]|nr:transporter permease [Bacteroidota bacterium]
MIKHALILMGEYFMFLGKVFSRPEKWKVFFKKLLDEMYTMGIGSLPIVLVVAVVMGAVVTLQTGMQIESNWVPKWTVGFTARTSIIMEFCPTIMSLLLIGNLGSRITAEIGGMRVTEQIDALDVMGINSSSFLVLPKIVALLVVNPTLIILSMFCALGGGYIVSLLSPVVAPHDYVDGITSFFRMYDVYYSLIKTFVFAFVIGSVASFHGYKIEGGALELGKASTDAVVASSFIVLILNLVITQIML